MSKEKPQKPRGELKEQTTVKIPFEHLSEGVKRAIGYSQKEAFQFNPDPFRSTSVQGWRGRRNFIRAGGIGPVALIEAISKDVPVPAKLASAVSGVSLAFVTSQLITAPKIQRAHENLKEAINKHGLLDTKFEGHYPFRWMSPAFVAKTHPVFYVTGRGDLVFKKPTRLEYMRYLDQKRWYGKSGLLPWRWRVYLEPPQAPEKVKVWARERLAALVRRPSLEPAFSPARRRALSRVSK
ncbi:MAG: hypothetical protein V1722_05910 [Candidatus Micrarchaeota archaeon]